MAGANDLSDITPRNTRPARVLVGQRKNLKHNHTNVIVVSMFHRHQDHWDAYINREVRRINMILHESLEKLPPDATSNPYRRSADATYLYARLVEGQVNASGRLRGACCRSL
ncbi:hypothetical protein J6590_092716 [Homalodisca vitripennis]|nr:hypothetical protein J6590_092716 [Homalodisca vitripennis]